MSQNNLVRHEKGREIYNFRCYFCHGYSGDAKTLAASFLDPQPRDFTRADPLKLNRKIMIEAVAHGKQNTAMQGFSSILDQESINGVVDFVRNEFMLQKNKNTQYHTVENGWPNHEQYKSAFPFALGEIKMDGAWEELTAQEQIGKRIFLSSCVSCHDRGQVQNGGVLWELVPLSFPRSSSVSDQTHIDAASAASPYAVHDKKPNVADLTELQRNGERLFQQNCAFCHAADGSGRNWIGSFLKSHPRDLTNAKFMQKMTRKRLKSTIMHGLPNTTMPAWKDVLSGVEIEAIIDYIDRVFYAVARDNDELNLSERELPTPSWSPSEKYQGKLKQ